MKWPSELVLLRHGESEYNLMVERKEKDALYQEFARAYESWITSQTKRQYTKRRNEALNLKRKVQNKFRFEFSDYLTPLTMTGKDQARVTARTLSKLIAPPQIIFVSPYLRTLETLDCMKEGWSELSNAEAIYHDERLREKEHGLGTLYNDARIFHLLHPEQYRLKVHGGPYFIRYSNGENVPDVRDRGRSWITTVIREFSEKNVLVITHHIQILAIRANLERLSPEEFIDLDKNQTPINCGVTLYRGDPNQGRDGRLILEFYNKKLY